MDNPLRRKIGNIPVWLGSLTLALALSVGLLAALGPDRSLWAQTDSVPSDSYIYTVQRGDSWGTVAARTGVSVDALKDANPDKVRETDWLLEGEELVVPVAAGTPGRTHTVQRGESWSSISAQYGVTTNLLQAANPRSVRPGLLLYRGEQLIIPPAASAEVDATTTPDSATPEDATPEVTATATETLTLTVEIPGPRATVTVTAAATETATETVTETDDADPTDEADEVVAGEDITGDETAGEEITDDEAVAPAVPTVSAAATATPEPEPEAVVPACPTRFLDYPQALTQAINADPENGPDVLLDFLETCQALAEDGFVAQDLTGNEIDDVVVIYRNPSLDSIFVESDLVIFNGSETGYTLAYRARAAGEVRLLAVADVNENEQMDVVWVDTTCGASTCFDTVNVRSWSGDAWADWTEGTITMAYATIELAQSSQGDGQDIVLQGGIYGSVGAGPQRSREEVWASVEGAPYALIERSHAESECLYHVVLDANAAFLAGPEAGFAEAESLYTQAATDEQLIKCWVRPDEVEELRSFSLFRLALIAGYLDDAELAAERAEAVVEEYPEATYEAVAAIWLREYRTTSSAAEACSVVTQFAELTPDTWEILADYGYTNPSFEATDVCPVLQFDDDEADDAGDESDASDESDDTESDDSAGAPEGALASFPACPAALSGYAATLAGVLEVAGGDEDVIEAWLVSCRALTEDRGSFLLTDITGDGITDAIFFPVLVADLGFGPDGAQGTVLIYHGDAGGDYTLALNPEIYGKPEPLEVADLNGNGQTEVAWAVTGCSTFCVIEVQMWSWDGEAYVPAILPGATMANGAASFEPLATTTGEDAYQLGLLGGVSGTPEGGLETPHLEIWQSIDGAPYQRVQWQYDRDATGSNCLALRLIEADVALQAAAQIGYEPAIELYRDALTEDLVACSLMEIDADEELALLRGLATFRLIQAHALDDDLEAAEAYLIALEEEEAATGYAEVARAWWDAFAASATDSTAGDSATACALVLPMIEEEPILWQITDHYGYNHPALAAEQICFAP